MRQADAYTLAVIANFAADYGRDREFTDRAMQALARCPHRKGRSGLVDRRRNRRLLAGRERRRGNHRPGRAGPAQMGASLRDRPARPSAYLSSKKDAYGTWGTTQATIMALRALLLSTEKGAADVRGTLRSRSTASRRRT